MVEERLHKVLAAAGIASRRTAEGLIAAGRVRVNGQVVDRPGTLANPDHDRIEVDGRRVRAASDRLYLALHKPAGVVTTVRDPEGRPTVIDLTRRPGARGEPPPDRRLYPVGRLDRDSSGLVLLTDDGALAERLTHPRYQVEKEYGVTVAGHPSTQTLETFAAGVPLDGRRTAPARIRLLAHHTVTMDLAVVLREGRRRQIRRMFDVLGHPVLQLRRQRLGPLRLGALPEGRWRYLTATEVADLRRISGLARE